MPPDPSPCAPNTNTRPDRPLRQPASVSSALATNPLCPASRQRCSTLAYAPFSHNNAHTFIAFNPSCNFIQQRTKVKGVMLAPGTDEHPCWRISNMAGRMPSSRRDNLPSPCVDVPKPRMKTISSVDMCCFNAIAGAHRRCRPFRAAAFIYACISPDVDPLAAFAQRRASIFGNLHVRRRRQTAEFLTAPGAASVRKSTVADSSSDALTLHGGTFIARWRHLLQRVTACTRYSRSVPFISQHNFYGDTSITEPSR